MVSKVTGFSTYKDRQFDLFKLHCVLWLSMYRQGLMSEGLNKERVAACLVLQEIYFSEMSEETFKQTVHENLNLGQAMVSAWATALSSDLPAPLSFYSDNKTLVESYIDTLEKGAKVAQEIINGSASDNNQD